MFMTPMMTSKSFRVLIHGGAGVIDSDKERVDALRDSLAKIVRSIYQLVSEDTSSKLTALDVVEFGVKLLEDDPQFNAGRGSVFNLLCKHELEASIMDGTTKKFGAASLIRNTKNPISVARAVMEHTKHSYLAGEEAELLARKCGLEFVENSYFSTDRRYGQIQKHLAQLEESKSSEPNEGKKGTVGCVCYLNGHIAAATSTGGLTAKMPGRIGDTPLIGCGTYANNKTCAVSFTGTGELIMRHVGAYDVSARMEYGHVSLQEALKLTIFDSMPADSAGAIAVDGHGNFSMEFNTLGMLRGMCSDDGTASIGIFKQEETIAL